MDYITTNVRFDKEDYMRLKAEAARNRKSFSAIVREKVKNPKKNRSKAKVAKFLAKNDRLAREMGKKLKGFDIVKALREMRYEGKW